MTTTLQPPTATRRRRVLPGVQRLVAQWLRLRTSDRNRKNSRGSDRKRTGPHSLSLLLLPPPNNNRVLLCLLAATIVGRQLLQRQPGSATTATISSKTPPSSTRHRQPQQQQQQQQQSSPSDGGGGGGDAQPDFRITFPQKSTTAEKRHRRPRRQFHFPVSSLPSDLEPFYNGIQRRRKSRKKGESEIAAPHDDDEDGDREVENDDVDDGSFEFTATATTTQRRRRHCQRPAAWSGPQSHFPVCNTLHELSLVRAHEQQQHQQEELIWAIPLVADGGGGMCSVWRIARQRESAVLKTLKTDQVRTDGTRATVALLARRAQTESLILERLTASPRIIGIWGVCGISVLTEHAAGRPPWDDHAWPARHRSGTDELVRLLRDRAGSSEGAAAPPPPLNNITATEQLDLALQMAESIAELHGFAGGAVVHGDVHPFQWLRTADGRLRLNDLNRGLPLDWNAERRNYCKAAHCYAGRPHRPFRCDQTDVFRFGNSVALLLTGSWHYQCRNPDDRRRVAAAIDGALLLLREEEKNRTRGVRRRSDSDSDSDDAALATLLRVMRRAWNVEEQVSIFELAEQLRRAQGKATATTERQF